MCMTLSVYAAVSIIHDTITVSTFDTVLLSAGNLLSSLPYVIAQ